MSAIPSDKPMIDVSPRALAVARQIDRLAAGTYIIELEKIDDHAAQWDCEISGVVRVKEFKAYEPKDKLLELPNPSEGSKI